MKKVLAIILAVCAAAVLLGACGSANVDSKEEEIVFVPWNPTDKGPLVTITMKDGGVIKAELCPEKAPNTVNNFISLANSGYFEGKVFHRAVAGFMIQGGSPTGDGQSIGFPYSIKGEFVGNGFAQNDMKHSRGVLSMARTNMPDSAGCQFFIMHGDAPHLDGAYAAFGKVTSGMDVVDKIATSRVNGDSLVKPPAIQSVTVDLNGYEFSEPETIPEQQPSTSPWGSTTGKKTNQTKGQ